MQLELFNPGVKRNDVPVKLETVTNKITFRKLVTIDNLEHNMLIHGYLRALHDYIFDFGLENTACYMISRSGIAKEDLIRCQLETEWNNEKMLAIIEKAFLKNPEDDQEEKERRLTMRPKDLLAIGMIGFPAKQHFAFNEVVVSDHFLQTAEDAAWEECIEDAKAKIEVIKTRIAEEEKRHNEVLALGYSFANNFYYYKGIRFDLSSYMKVDADNWVKTIEYLEKQPAEIDAAIKLHQERYTALSPYATFGEKVDMDKLAELTSDRFNELLTSKKAAYDTKIANDLEEEKTRQANEKAESLAKSSDAVKLQHVIDHLPVIPEMASVEYMKIAGVIKQKFDEIRGLIK